MNYTLLDFVLDYARCCILHVDVSNLNPDFIYTILDGCPVSTSDDRNVLDYKFHFDKDDWFVVDAFVDQKWERISLGMLYLNFEWTHTVCTQCEKQ
jgi:hypothetical protein